MVAYLPSSKPSKVAPRRHWSTMQGLLVHSRQLQQVLQAVEREDRTNQQWMRLRSPRATMAMQRSVMPLAKPLVFRKTKREIQRERELAEKQKQQQAMQAHVQDPAMRMCCETSVIMRQLDSFRSTLLASCKRLTGASSTRQATCRTQYARRPTSSSAIGLSRRCPPRRRLLF